MPDSTSDNGKSEVMTAEEVAYYLKFHLKTVYKLANSGYLPGSRIGKNWRFLRRDVERLLKNTNETEKGSAV